MTNLRQAAQRALKEMDDHMYRADTHEFYEAKEALRAALAEPEQEPKQVAWAKPFRGILPWGQNPPDNDGTWFSFRGADSFMWLDGAWFQMPPAPVVPWPGRQATPQPEQEPVAKVEYLQTGGNAGIATRIVEIDDPLRERLRAGTLLYTAPTPRKPLTDEEIQLIWAKTFEMGSSANTFARAIEKAHGIGEQHDQR